MTSPCNEIDSLHVTSHFGHFHIRVTSPCNGSIDPLHVTSHFGNVRIRPFDRRYVVGQKCTAVIERKALIVSLFTNTSDYSSETTIFVRYKHIDLSLLE